MKLENQVVSLKYAKKLKELGFKQESLFYWADTRINELATGKDKHLKLVYPDGGNYLFKISAYTVAELGEMIGELAITEKMDKWYTKRKGELMIKPLFDKTEANARAKMLIYLKENKLL